MPQASLQISDGQKDAIRQALNLRQDVHRFQQTWPTLNAVDEPVPPFTWKELERQLSSLAVSPHAALMASDLVNATRKQARFKPGEMVLREILCVASALMDEGFPLASDAGEAPMT